MAAWYAGHWIQRKARGSHSVTTHRTTGKATPSSPVHEAAPPASGLQPRSRGRRWYPTPVQVFWLMFAINALNYLDRLLVVAVGPTLKAEFHLHDSQIGALGTAFLLIYTLTALPVGLLADRRSRARVVAAGVVLWSMASTATGIVRGLGGLFATRAAVGIGEASYFPAGTALLSAYYSLERRARIMSRWGAAQLVGAALAFALSAAFAHWLGARGSWRLLFFFTGLPGLILALLMWFVADAPRSASAQTSEHPPSARDRDDQATLGLVARLRTVANIRTIRVVILLQALTFVSVTPTVTFLPIYLRSAHSPFHLGIAQADLVAGTMVVIGGLTGALIGGNVADWFGQRVRGGRVFAAGVGFGLALPCYATMLATRSISVFVITGTFAVLFLSIQSGPLTAAVQDATPPALRATAVAVTLLLSHVLGDVWAPLVVGLISTALHERAGMALLIVGTPALAIAMIAGMWGARIYANDVSVEIRTEVFAHARRP